ncbi:outer membrane protein AlgE [Pseudomonas chlororaphis]|nr:outer membrane protein AlgE [Pseudomonas chlororaphis]
MIGVHIRYCGNGHLGFRPYGGSLWKSAKVTKALRPSIRCLAKARHALTPALLRGPAATGHPWPGAASAASLPRYPLRNACVRPLGKGQVDQGQDQKPKPSAFYALLVAAAAGCDRARSARQTRRRGVSGGSRRMVLRLLRSRSQPAAAATGQCTASASSRCRAQRGCDRARSARQTRRRGASGRSRWMVLRLLRSRSQPAAAATGNVFSDRPTGRSPRVVFDFLAPSGGRVEVLRSGQPGRDAGLAAPGHGWPVAAAHGAGPERGNPSLGEDRTLGARALWLLWGSSKVTRRKGETLSGRYRSNGYVPQPRCKSGTLGGHDRSTGPVHSQAPELLP